MAVLPVTALASICTSVFSLELISPPVFFSKNLSSRFSIVLYSLALSPAVIRSAVVLMIYIRAAAAMNIVTNTAERSGNVGCSELLLFSFVIAFVIVSSCVFLSCFSSIPFLRNASVF